MTTTRESALTCDGGQGSNTRPTACGRDVAHAAHPLGIAPEAAMKWVAKCEDDANSCTPCKDNNGRTYRNRQAAYRDYPGGSGYVKCEGQANCRCSVVKRGSEGNEMDPKRLAALAGQARDAGRKVSARAIGEQSEAPHEKLRTVRNDAGGNALYIYDAIGGWDGIQALDVVEALAGMSGPLDVHVNSYGGVIFEGAAIFNALDNYAGVKTGYVDGVAASAASFILMACDEIVTAKNGTMMVHDGSGLCWGNADDMRDTADLLDMLSDTIAQTYADKTGGKAAEWRDVMRGGDAWYNAEAMVTAGLADRIAGVAAAADPEPATPDEPAPDEPAPDTNAMRQQLLALFGDVSRETRPATAVVDTVASMIDTSLDDVQSLRAALMGAFA